MAAYITQQRLEYALGPQALTALYDDEGDGTLNTDAMDDVIRRASARTTSRLATNYTGTLPLPDPPPEMAAELALEYAIAFSYQRNPDYMRALGIDWLKLVDRADALAEKFQLAIVRMVDAPAPTPANVGGDVYSMATAVDYPCPPAPFFIDGMGDF
jgi:hypothetical protein